MLGGEVFNIEGYCDSDNAADPDKRRSTGGYVFVLAGRAISWGSKLLPTVARSTLEAEYLASAWGAKEALWLHKLMTTLRGAKEQKALSYIVTIKGRLLCSAVLQVIRGLRTSMWRIT
jgi:hypothetical protein